MAEKRSDPDSSRDLNRAALAYGIPMLMLSGPLAGFLLGYGIVKFFGIQGAWVNRVKLIALILGLISGFYESFKVLKRISKD